MTKYHTEEERKEATREYYREYRKTRKAKYAELQRSWRASNPQRAKEIDNKSYQLTKKQNKRSRMLAGAKDRARQYSLPFDLEIEDIVIPEFCPVLGIKLESGRHTTRPELDRIKPELGYVKGNVCVISGRANRIKYNATPAELAAVLAYVKVP